MADPELTRAHIVAMERLRRIIAQAVERIWESLPSYNEPEAEQFVATAVPLVLAAQRQSVALTDAYLARAVGRLPLGPNATGLIGAAVRGGAAPEEVYHRPFVTTWKDLSERKPWEDAVAAGKHRATSAAATDVQLSMRATLRAVGDADDLILGYRRVPDGDACEFCKLVAGRRYLTDQLMEIHNHCGCGVDVVTAANRDEFFGKRANDLAIPLPAGVAVHEHGELGPVLADPAHNFTSESDLLAA